MALSLPAVAVFLSSSVRSFKLAGYLCIMLSLLQLACALVVPPLIQQAGANPVPVIRQTYAPGHRGAVASESTICSDIGIDLLRQGGNAADAVSWHPFSRKEHLCNWF